MAKNGQFLTKKIDQSRSLGDDRENVKKMTKKYKK